MASSLDCCHILSCQEQTLKQIRSMLTGAEPSMHARARVNGREPATKELALWKALREACSRDGHLLRAESVVVTHSHSSPCSANRSTGCFSVQSSVLSRVAKSVTYTYKNPDFIFHWEHKSITAAWLMSSADEKKADSNPEKCLDVTETTKCMWFESMMIYHPSRGSGLRISSLVVNINEASLTERSLPPLYTWLNEGVLAKVHTESVCTAYECIQRCWPKSQSLQYLQIQHLNHIMYNNLWHWTWRRMALQVPILLF